MESVIIVTLAVVLWRATLSGCYVTIPRLVIVVELLGFAVGVVGLKSATATVVTLAVVKAHATIIVFC